VTTPDGLRIEILEDKNQSVPIRHEHVHLFLPEAAIPEAQAWYVKTFGAKAGERANNPVADIPGVQMRFAKTETPAVTTKGRILDHIGFDVKDHPAFVKKIEAEVTGWPHTSVHPHRFRGREFRFENAELGHVHEGGVVDIPFPRPVRDWLLANGLAQEHHWVPNSGWTTFHVRTAAAASVTTTKALAALTTKEAMRSVEQGIPLRPLNSSPSLQVWSRS